MRRDVSTILMIAAVAGGVCMVGAQWRYWRSSERQLATRQQRLREIQRDAFEIERLRGRAELVSVNERPAGVVMAQVNAVLARAGIPPNRMTELRNESDTAVRVSNVNGPVMRRQSMSIRFAEITIDELGAFLQNWAAEQPEWVPLRLTVSRRAGTSRSTAEDERCEVQLVIAAVYAASQETKP